MLRNLWNRFIRGHKTSRQIRTLKHRPLRSGLEPLEQRRLLSITEHTLVYPLDAGPWDADSDAAEVSVAMTLKHFDVQLYDADGIKDSTVHSQDVDLYKKVGGQWVQQTEGTDYAFSYDAANDLVVLASKLSGNKYPVAEYKIFVDGSGIQDNNDNNVADKTIYPTITANEAVIAVIPDSQKMTTTANDALKFNTETQFIVDNLATDNIQFVTHVGDVVNDSWTGTQWTRAVTAMDKLDDLEKTGGPNYEDGLLPYGVCPGNHDYDNATFSYQHLSASDFVRNFGAKRYAGLDWYGGASEGTVADELNHYQIFEACGYRFLHITLEREARDTSLAWAQRVIETHPDLPVILSTHSFLTSTPALSEEKKSNDPTCNSGKNIWDELVKKNDQIFLVLCGHNEVTDAKLWSDTNLAQHTVYGALIDFQGLKDGDMNRFEYVYLRPDTGRIDLKYVDPDTGTKSDDGGWNMTFSTRLSFSGVAPKARLFLPVDNGPDDNDADADEVKVHARQAEFVVQLADVGEGIDDSTVTNGTASVQRNGTTLTQGTDYSVSYDSAEDRITLTPVGRTDFQIGSYTVTLNGGASKITDKGNNQLAQKSLTIVIDPAASSTVLAAGAPVRVLVPTADPGNTDWREKYYFDDGSWRIGQTGVGYDTSWDYQYDIGLDVTELKDNQNNNNSAYLRIKFDLPTDPSEVDTLKLKIKSDDGFAAFLNAGDAGMNHTVASARAPSPLAWNSAATSTHAAGAWEEIDISAHKDHLKRGPNLLAIQGLNDSTGSTEFLTLPRLVATYKDGPRADLTTPLDNGSSDLDPRQTWAMVTSASSFTVQLSDLSHQIDDNTVVEGTVSLKRDGTLLTEGTDYDFQYTASTDVIQLTPHAGGNFAGGTYEVILNGGASKIKDNASPTPAEMPQTSFTVEVSSLADDVTLVATNASVKYKVPTAAINNWNTQSFDDSAWSSGTLGIGYDKLGDYASLIGTDVAASMYDTNPSMYLRAKYDLGNPDVAHFFRLNIQHDDGFVAYVNGKLAAFKNPPLKAAAWNSATERISHDESAADQTETILFTVHGPNDGEPLNCHLDNVLAIQVFNLNKASSDLLVRPELVVVTDVPKWTYTFTGGVLTINGAADADTLVVSSETIDGQKWVKVGEEVLVSPRVPAADVQQIKVHGNGGNDTINLAGVTSANGFTSLAASSIYGGEGDDTITGSPFDDKIYGDAGADSLLANGGDDTLVGGAGDDTLRGGANTDTFVFSGTSLGSDKITETAADGGTDLLDFSSFGAAITTLNMGSTSAQTVNAGNLTLTLSDASAIENVKGSSSADNISGNSLDNKIWGGDGADTIYGYGGHDTIEGEVGADKIYGETGSAGPGDEDSLVGGDGADTIYGGGGADTIFGDDVADSFTNADLLNGEWGYHNDYYGSYGGADYIAGGKGDDTIYGEHKADTILGGDGHDRIYADYCGYGNDYYGGADCVVGGAGNDTVYGGYAGDTIYGDDVDSQLTGNDLLYGDCGMSGYGYASGGDYIAGGQGQDSMYGEQGADTILGGDGHDYILADYCGSGNDYYGGADCVQAGAGNDTVYGGYGNDSLYGQDDNDLLVGDCGSLGGYGYGSDYIEGGRGDDTLYGGYGSDRLYGDFPGVTSEQGFTYVDLIFGDDGDDTIWAGIGTDTVHAGYGNDLVYIDDSAGGDSADGGGGTDTVHYNTGDTILNFESSTWHA